MGLVDGFLLVRKDPVDHGLLLPAAGAKQTQITQQAHRQDDHRAAGDIAERSRVSLIDTLDGVLPHSYGDENLFWRIWFEPEYINAAFIVEDVDYTVKIWNAYLDTTAVISAIVATNPTGTSIDHEPLPISLAKFADVNIDITVLGEGPPIQDTTYTFTINAVDYTTEIEGIRVIQVPWSPDWDAGIRIEMLFETALNRNKYFEEQRRPLREAAFHKVSVRISAWNNDGQKLKQTLAYGHDKVFGVPLYSEKAYPASSFNGSSVINTTENLSDLWYLNNQAEYVAIIDHTTLLTEIKGVSSVGATSISFITPVVQTFDYRYVTLYPVVMSTAQGMRIMAETDDVFEARLNFEEYVRTEA